MTRGELLALIVGWSLEQAKETGVLGGHALPDFWFRDDATEFVKHVEPEVLTTVLNLALQPPGRTELGPLAGAEYAQECIAKGVTALLACFFIEMPDYFIASTISLLKDEAGSQLPGNVYGRNMREIILESADEGRIYAERMIPESSESDVGVPDAIRRLERMQRALGHFAPLAELDAWKEVNALDDLSDVLGNLGGPTAREVLSKLGEGLFPESTQGWVIIRATAYASSPELRSSEPMSTKRMIDTLRFYTHPGTRDIHVPRVSPFYWQRHSKSSWVEMALNILLHPPPERTDPLYAPKWDAMLAQLIASVALGSLDESLPKIDAWVQDPVARPVLEQALRIIEQTRASETQ